LSHEITVSYTWDIGGEKYSGEKLTFNVAATGTYYASLTVSDGKESNSDTLQIVVEKNIEKDEAPETALSEWQARCTRIIDGDTIELEDGSRIQYIGIDSPETDQNFGPEAAQKNRSLVEGKTVTLVKDISDTDKYGRILAYVYVGDLFINAHLVREGFAQVYTVPPDVKYSDIFLDNQNQAQNEGKGIWGLEVEAAEEEAPPVETSPGQFCGSKKSEVYHYPSCHYVNTIKSTNLVWYSDSSDARAKGKRPCKKCTPP
jgi:micrococcal nuclease